MDEARVVINLKEGVIELQGPVDFVRQYLDTYQSVIKGLESAVVAAADVQAPSRVVKAAARGGKRKRASYKAAIHDALEEGFFDEPRSPREVKQRLGDMGFSFTDSGVRAILRRLSLAGVLETVREGGTVCYKKSI